MVKPLVRETNKERYRVKDVVLVRYKAPNGQPVLFMNDHPITGGYPVIASVAAYHLDLISADSNGVFGLIFRQISDLRDLKINVQFTCF